MSENISDREIYMVTAGEPGYVVYAEYDGVHDTVDLEEVLNDLAARLRALEAEVEALRPKEPTPCEYGKGLKYEGGSCPGPDTKGWLIQI